MKVWVSVWLDVNRCCPWEEGNAAVMLAGWRKTGGHDEKITEISEKCLEFVGEDERYI